MKSTRDIFTKLKYSSTKWENYFEIYDKWFPQYIGKHPHLMEIGVGGGGSIEMWLKYFENDVTIYALDYDKDSLDYKFDNADVRYSCVDQSSYEHWDAYLKDDPKFDIIIDDGSHIMDHQIVTLNRLFKHLNDGGIYIIEDVCTSYWSNYGGGFKKQTSFIEYVKNLIDLLNAQHVPGASPPKELTDMFPNLKSATFYNNVVIIEKGPIKNNKTYLVSDDFKNPTFEWN
jgi:hypothetical protein